MSFLPDKNEALVLKFSWKKNCKLPEVGVPFPSNIFKEVRMEQCC
jgi:hypothetical protein